MFMKYQNEAIHKSQKCIAKVCICQFLFDVSKPITIKSLLHKYYKLKDMSHKKYMAFDTGLKNKSFAL